MHKVDIDRICSTMENEHKSYNTKRVYNSIKSLIDGLGIQTHGFEPSILDFSLSVCHEEYHDTFRVGISILPETIVKFGEISSKGCCGNQEKVYVDADGVVLLLGCNYGH